MNIAMYMRLSSQDLDTGISKLESHSIVNQRMYISKFLDHHETLASHRRIEYIDDGFSGAYTNRPQLTNMLEHVKKGEVQAICVKDFSRFFRDYLEAGEYLECIFPHLGVRFISINDNYDSDNYKGTTGGIEMAMRNIIYASYSKDLSIKTSTAKELMMKQGKFVGSHAPYGYRKHPTINNKLAIDQDSAIIVKNIFNEAIAGNNTSDIAKELNARNVPTPAQYFKSKHPTSNKFNFTSAQISWTSAMVYLILTNERYTGALVSGRKKKVSHNVNKYVKKEPIVVKGTHQPIVSQEEFSLAQRVIVRKGKVFRQQKEYPLKSLLRCKECNRLMCRKEGKMNGSYFQCIYSIHSQNIKCNQRNKIDEKEIEDKVFHAILDYLSLINQMKIQTKNPREQDKLVPNKLRDKSERARNKQEKLHLYECYVKGIIEKQEYIERKFKLEKDQKEMEVETMTVKDDGIDHKYISQTTLTNDMAKAFIQCIYLDHNMNMEIEWKFQNIFQ